MWLVLPGTVQAARSGCGGFGEGRRLGLTRAIVVPDRRMLASSRPAWPAGCAPTENPVQSEDLFPVCRYVERTRIGPDCGNRVGREGVILASHGP